MNDMPIGGLRLTISLLLTWRCIMIRLFALILALAFSVAVIGSSGAEEVDSEQSKATAEIRKLHGKVKYARTGPDYGPVIGVSLALPFVTDAAMEHVRGLSQLQSLKLNGTHVTDTGLAHIKGLTKLQTLSLLRTKVTDAGLVHLEELTQLEFLDLGGTRVNGEGLAHLKQLSKLKLLYLWDTDVTDAGLKHIDGLSNLQDLLLQGTKITDAGLVHLKGLTKLRELNLGRTQVTDEGVQKLQQALPDCKIIHSNASKPQSERTPGTVDSSEDDETTAILGEWRVVSLESRGKADSGVSFRGMRYPTGERLERLLATPPYMRN